MKEIRRLLLKMAGIGALTATAVYFASGGYFPGAALGFMIGSFAGLLPTIVGSWTDDPAG
jgi:hypothetical protein